MHFRLARQEDVAGLTAVHLAAAREQQSRGAGGFLEKLGATYLKEYYRVFLREPHSLILVAVDDQGIAGLVSGTLDAEEHRDALRKHRYRLFLSMLPALLKNVRLLGPVIRRARSLSDGEETGYVWLEGPRWEYWGWDPARPSAESVVLQKKWIAILKLLGAKIVTFEVDEVNVRVAEYHKRMGAEVIREYSTPEGNRRLLMRYDLEK